MIWCLAASAHAGAYVLEADTLRDLSRAVKVARRADPDVVVGLGPRSVCVAFDEPEPRVVLRLTRRLGRSPESRLSCDVARYPLGRGFIAILLDPPAEGLTDALTAVGLDSHEIKVWEGLRAPIGICVPRAALPEPLDVADDLTSKGFDVQGVYEVGGCRRS